MARKTKKTKKQKKVQYKATPGRVQHGRYIGYLRHAAPSVKRSARKLRRLQGAVAAIRFLRAAKKKAA